MNSLCSFIKGECPDMCPESERNLRQKEKILHVLETIPGTENKPKTDKNRAVKCFSRSAAGTSLQNPKCLRPTHVLIKTIDYLLGNVIGNSRVPWHVTYDFICDRLRSVRQDMVIQNLSTLDSIFILEPIVRFHAYAAYRLCNETIYNFDPVLNRTHLQECTKRLLCLYDEFESECKKSNNCTLAEKIENSRVEFEALYVVLNLGSTVAVSRALSIPKKWRTVVLELAIQLSLNYYRKNYVRLCRNLKELPSLVLAIGALHLPEIRREALSMMSVAYNSKNLPFPLDLLRKIFLYDSIESVIEDCKAYGLNCANNNVYFNKKNFKLNSAPTALHSQFVDEKLNLSGDLYTILKQ